MKRAIAALLCALLLCALLPAAAETAAEQEVLRYGSYQYVLLEDGTAEIRKYRGGEANLTIPDQLNGVKVTAIGNEAFWLCSSLTSVSIPDSVTTASANPFVCCTNLSDVKVSPDHPALAVIDGVLFSKQDKRLVWYPMTASAKAYAIPQGINIIGDYAFSFCSSLVSVTIPDSVTAIGDYAFFRCSSLASVSIPDSVTEIGDFAFDDCSSLASVTIPDSVTAIGDYAFSGCERLTLTVPRNSYAAQYCKDNGLTYIYPDSLDWLNQ